MINYIDLLNEVQTDPQGLNYAPFIPTGSDQSIADILNLRNRAAIYRSNITPKEILGCIIWSEYIALTQAQRDLLALMFATNTIIDASLSSVREAFSEVFSAPGSVSLTNLATMAQRPGSRAEELFGVGTTISPTDVAIALRG